MILVIVPALAKIGIIELAAAALSGWAMVVSVERPDWFRRIGVRHLGRIRQAHLDAIFMGLILVAVGLSVRPLPSWIGVLLVIGAVLQPLLFLPLAISAETQEHVIYRLASAAFFVGTSIAWIALAIAVLGR
jgi:hypothetical protein